MTLASQTSRISYVGDGSTTAFAVPFFFAANTDIVVMLQNSSGVQSTLVLGTDYTLSGAGVSSGGTVTFIVAPTSTTGAVVSIYRDPPVTQTTSYNNNDPFPAKSHEAALDKLTTLEQRTRDLITRSLRIPDSDPTLSTTLPTKLSRANKLMGFDSSGVPTAVLGPSFVGGTDVGAALVSTKAVAQVTTFAGSVLYLIIGGTSAAGDTTQQTYIRGTGTGSFTDGGSVSWKPVPTPPAFGTSVGLVALGDGTTNDQAAIQAAIDAVAAIGGGSLYLTPGKTYRVVINSGVTDLGLIIKSGVTLILNSATINLECTGSVYGIRLQSKSHIIGPGTVATTVSSSPGSQSVWHAPIGLGAAYGEVTSTGALGNYLNATRWSIRNLILTTVRSGGYHIAGIGGMSHGVVEDIEYLASANPIGCLNFDWGTVGNINSANVTASRAVYDAGTGYTVHPNNIYVRRLKIGAMTNASSCPIRLSGVHAVRIDGFEIASCNAYGVFHTAGDLGYEFAIDNATRRLRHSGIVIKNGLIDSAGTSAAIYCDAYADNIAAAVALGYSPYLAAINTTDIVFENIRSIGNIASSAADGITAKYMEGGTFRNCYMLGHQRGMVIAEAAKRVRVEGGEYTSSYQDGIYIGAGTVPEEITIAGAWCWSNGIGGTYSGINVALGKRHKVLHCRVGNVGESFQKYGVQVGTSASDAEILNNHCIGHSTGGAAWNLATSTSYGVLAQFDGNTIDTNYVTTPFTGLNILPYTYIHNIDGDRNLVCRAKRSALTGDTTPTAGAWKGGDTIFFTNPAAAGKIGTTCVSTGSPGTWKQFGAVDA